MKSETIFIISHDKYTQLYMFFYRNQMVWAPVSWQTGAVSHTKLFH